jgi:hypothetical protein
MTWWDTFSKSSKDVFSGTEMPIRCYESHPP